MPPKMGNGPGRGVDGVVLPRGGWHIAREDIADFMVKQIGNRDWIGRRVYISW
jgi:hypothetical protein